MTSSGEPDSVRAVARALDILRTMNRRAVWSLRDLHLAVGLPKTTVFRLLHTLVQEGYVQADEKHGQYRLAARVRELSAGYGEASRLVDVGGPIALAVTRRIKWPLAIGTLDHDALVVRYSSMPNSPLAVQATTVGQRLGLLDTAMGRVYLAFCGPAERHALLELLRAAARGQGAVGLDGEAGILADLTAIRRAGHAVRMPGGRRTSATLAVPVIAGTEAIAALGMTTFGRLMTAETIAAHAPLLRQTAAAIAAAWATAESVTA